MHVLDYFLVILRSESKKGEQITRFSSPLHYSMIRTRLPPQEFSNYDHGKCLFNKRINNNLK